MICEKNELLKDKVLFIIGQKDEHQLEEDLINKKALKIIFQGDKEIKFPKINIHQDLLIHYLNLVHIIFSYHKKKRKKIYNTKFIELKDKDIKNIIEYCGKIIGKVNIEEKYKKLYKIVNDSFITTNCCLSDYVYALIWNISFILDKNTLTLYILYSLIFNYIKLFSERTFDFNDVEINICDEICLSLIFDLFNAKYKGKIIILLLSIFILKYNYFQKKYKFINKELIIEVISNIYNKYGQTINDYKNEDIILLISEEIGLSNINIEKASKVKFNNNNDLNKELIQQNILIMDETNNNKKNDNFDNKPLNIINKNEEKDSISNKMQNFSKDLEVCNNNKNININEFWDKKFLIYKNGINEIFKNILNKMSLDNEKDYLNKQIDELKNIFIDLIESNQTLRKEMGQINNKFFQVEKESAGYLAVRLRRRMLRIRL